MNRKKGESKLVFNKETRTIKPQISKMLEISRLKSRIKELEEALKKIIARTTTGDKLAPRGRQMASQVRDIVRKALEQKAREVT